MYIEPGIIAAALGIFLFIMGMYYGRQRGIADGAKGTLDMLEEQGLIRQIEYNGDLQILPITEEKEKKKS